jgi:flagellar hook-length control protein FliK
MTEVLGTNLLQLLTGTSQNGSNQLPGLASGNANPSNISDSQDEDLQSLISKVFNSNAALDDDLFAHNIFGSILEQVKSPVDAKSLEESSSKIQDIIADVIKSIENKNLKLKMEDSSDDDLPIYAAVLNTISQQVENKINDLVRDIAEVNLDSYDKVDVIIEKSDQLKHLEQVQDYLSEELHRVPLLDPQKEPAQRFENEITKRVADKIDTLLDSVLDKFTGTSTATNNPASQTELPADLSDLDLDLQGAIKTQIDTSSSMSSRLSDKLQKIIDSSADLSAQLTSATEHSKKLNIEDYDKNAKIELSENKIAEQEERVTRLADRSTLDSRIRQSLLGLGIKVNNRLNQDLNQLQKAVNDTVKFSERMKNTLHEIINQSDELSGNIERAIDKTKDLDVEINSGTSAIGKNLTDLNHISKEKSSVKPHELRQLLSQEITPSLSDNTSRQLKIQLNPEHLGAVEINITKENNQIEIKMLVHTDTALQSLKQELHELSNALKDRGLEIKDIRLAKSEDSSMDYGQGSQQNNSQYNQARDEQKERYANTAPTWLKDKSPGQKTFSDALVGVLETEA